MDENEKVHFLRTACRPDANLERSVRVTSMQEHVTCEGCKIAQSGYSAREIMLERARDAALADLKVTRKALEDAQERNAERVTLRERLTEHRLSVVADALKVANTTLSALLAARNSGLPSETRGAPVNAAQDVSEDGQRHRRAQSRALADRVAMARKALVWPTQREALELIIGQDHDEANVINDRLDWLRDNG